MKKYIIISIVSALVLGGLAWAWSRTAPSTSNDSVANTNSLVNSAVMSVGGPRPSTLELDDLGGSHLTTPEADELIVTVEKIDAYGPYADRELGGLECGQSALHDQLVTLNAGKKNSLLANGGLLVTATPNTFQWTQADLKTISNDPTLVCGVGTTVPHGIVGNSVLWWSRCTGGAGPPEKGTPYYDESVHCLQAQEVLEQQTWFVE